MANSRSAAYARLIENPHRALSVSPIRKQYRNRVNLNSTASAICALTRDIQDRMRRARDQLLTFAAFPEQVEATNNAYDCDLRPAVIQCKNTNGYRAT